MIEIKITADTAEQAKQDLIELAGVIGGQPTKLKVVKEESEDESEKPKPTRSRTTTKKVEKEEDPEVDPFGDEGSGEDEKITDKMLVDLAAEKREANEAKNMPKLKDLLAEYNVKKFSEVDDDDRAAFLKKLKKI